MMFSKVEPVSSATRKISVEGGKKKKAPRSELGAPGVTCRDFGRVMGPER